MMLRSSIETRPPASISTPTACVPRSFPGLSSSVELCATSSEKCKELAKEWRRERGGDSKEQGLSKSDPLTLSARLKHLRHARKGLRAGKDEEGGTRRVPIDVVNVTQRLKGRLSRTGIQIESPSTRQADADM